MTEPTTAANPNEMTAQVDLQIGSSVVLQARARATPAGLMAIGVLVSSIILSVAPLVWSARRRPY
ncbi:hypothetical protein [Roseomonas elaeocarpi]|uniref:Uncharacterized protein n=1 Tax=Roseomonas elaeocarpi TaxID=907779 RepID=A0ABV6JXA7_9PROT